MPHSHTDSPLYPLINPRSMAFFGASNNIAAMGTNLLLSVQALGFEGPIYPVHPQADTVLGLKAYRSVEDLPEAPDLAVIVLPTRIVNQSLEACGKRGIRNAVVVSGGFKERGGEGVALEQELVRIAKKYHIAVLGPNCLGVANPFHKLNTTFLPYEGLPGFIGLASQSGSFITQLFDYLSMVELGFSTAISVGNEAVIDVVDCMRYLASCPHTRVIALYVEGITRGRTFLKTARSIVPRKPIVAFYIGGSETGKQAGFSHTGAMAGPDDVYEGMFRQSGIIRARSVTEMLDFCWALGSLKRPRGSRVVIQTHSGGPGAAAADACGRAGLELPALSEETVEKLAPFVPGTGSVNNPVDLTFSRNPQDFFNDIPKILLDDDYTDILMIYFLTPSQVVTRTLTQMAAPPDRIAEESEKMTDQLCEQVANLIHSHDKPVVGFTFRSFEEPSVKGLLKRGIPVYPGPERGARSVAALTAYADIRTRLSKGS
ncbi:MAG: CoA-binding protein [Desulfatiglandaceae bacterium]